MSELDANGVGVVIQTANIDKVAQQQQQQVSSCQMSLSANKENKSKNEQKNQIKPLKKRYFILLMYAICSMEKSFQWINLSAITNKVAFYYQVSNLAVNFSSVLFMITFIPLVLPTSWLIERVGLRKAVLIGSFGIALGASIKCFADGKFYIVILGQVVVSLSEQFIFCIPARVASVWFPDNQVSLATGFGILGNQCGIALGYVIPQALLRGLETREEIGAGMWSLFVWTAAVAVLTWLVLLLLFDDCPKYAPGAARLRKIRQELEQHNKGLSFCVEMNAFGSVLHTLISDLNCVLLILAYGINVGTGYAIQTLLNQMITTSGTGWTRDQDELIGNSGMIIIVFGMTGALAWGFLCDLTRKYMAINRGLYLGAIISIFLFGITLHLGNTLALYGASALMGFTLIGYTVAGLDTMVELTYPIPELVSSSVMNLSPQIFGTAITFACSAIVDTKGSDSASGFLIACLAIGLILTMAIREHLKRQTAAHEENAKLSSSSCDVELAACSAQLAESAI